MSQDNLKAVLEALLFTSEKPLTLEQLKIILADFTVSQIKQILEELRSEYEKSNRGIRIIEIAGGFQMVTLPSLSPFLKKLYKERRIERFSKPALETLAIIAYKQPITRIEIEILRNVNVDGVLKNILEKSLIRIVGRKKAPGRPLVYGTTRQFLEYFGLKSLDELKEATNGSKKFTPEN